MKTTRRQAVLLLAFCGLLYLPGLRSTPFYTRGEAREALAVREVAHSGQWLVPMRPDGQLTNPRRVNSAHHLGRPAMQFPVRPGRKTASLHQLTSIRLPMTWPCASGAGPQSHEQP